MTGAPINYPAALTRIARAAMDPRNPGDFVGAMDAITLREAASELARLALSEATLRERVASLERELAGWRKSVCVPYPAMGCATESILSASRPSGRVQI